MNRRTIIIADDGGSVRDIEAPEVMHAVLRDGVTYCWLIEPRPNRHDEDTWVEVIWSKS